MVSRAEPSLSGRWWWSIDRLILTALVALMVSGVVLLMAGGPPVAERLGLSTFHFVNRQAAYLAVALAIFLGVSLMTPRQVRRAALLIYVVSLAMVVATLYFGVEVKGAKRWLTLGPLGSVQPSEFLKPAFVVLAAWAFASCARPSSRTRCPRPPPPARSRRASGSRCRRSRRRPSGRRASPRPTAPRTGAARRSPPARAPTPRAARP